MAYFITGGTGFIGRNFIDKLKDREGDIYVLTRAASMHKFEELQERMGEQSDRLIPVQGDLTEKLLAYALGAGFASVAGAFFAAKLSYTNPNFFLFMESCIVLCIVVLGGVGSISGIVVAAFVLIAAPEVFRGLENFRMLAFGGIMTTMMILKPEGLIPASRRRRELHADQEPPPKD